MAWANSDHNHVESSHWRRGKFDNIKDIIDMYKRTKPSEQNRIHFYKRWINGSRYALYHGNAKIINVNIDYHLSGEYNEKAEGRIPSCKIDASIDVKKNMLTVYDYNVLDRGSYLFGTDFHDTIRAQWHYGFTKLYGGTEHEIPECDSFYELKSPHKEDKYCFIGMEIDLETYKVLNNPPKAIKEKADAWFNQSRIRRNASARARRKNKLAQERLEKYRLSQDINDLDMKDAFRLFNVSERRVVIETFGMDTILANCNSNVLNSDKIDDRPYDLVQVEVEDTTVPNGVRWCNYLRMVNPSTAEIHFEGVPNTENTVQKALMWRDGDKESYVKPVVLT